MDYIKKFESHASFETGKGSLGTPYVAVCDKHVHYYAGLVITEDDLTKGDYVDLGLPSGTMWASCNIGATKPCEYGLLFQFGRVDGYACRDTNHQFRTKEQNLADTGNESIPATTSGKTYDVGEVLSPEDDAAYVATNGKAHMPTEAQIEELKNETTFEWCQCTVLGDDHATHPTSGVLFTSKTNGNSIFIPAAGHFSSWFYNDGLCGDLWSSSVYDSYSKSESMYGMYLVFGSVFCECTITERCNACSVRGVYEN